MFKSLKCPSTDKAYLCIDVINSVFDKTVEHKYCSDPIEHAIALSLNNQVEVVNLLHSAKRLERQGERSFVKSQ